MATRRMAKRPPRKSATPRAKPRLLSGGNPQIAKGDGEAPVQAYLAALPGWKREVGRRLDALVTAEVPTVRKAVKWNSPLYGGALPGWFLGLHAYNRFLRVTFFRGTSLRPMPPGESKVPGVRSLDVPPDGALDEGQFKAWVGEAAKRPGWVP